MRARKDQRILKEMSMESENWGLFVDMQLFKLSEQPMEKCPAMFFWQKKTGWTAVRAWYFGNLCKVNTSQRSAGCFPEINHANTRLCLIIWVAVMAQSLNSSFLVKYLLESNIIITVSIVEYSAFIPLDLFMCFYFIIIVLQMNNTDQQCLISKQDKIFRNWFKLSINLKHKQIDCLIQYF